ncbi:MAG: hypothetical protein ACI90V_004214, partial [Bacillariaceae sp.]
MEAEQIFYHLRVPSQKNPYKGGNMNNNLINFSQNRI